MQEYKGMELLMSYYVNQILQVLLHPIPNIILSIFFEEENPNLNGWFTPRIIP
jgi:hypothetical protein